MKNGERTKNGKGKRQANFELLRIISMFMVVSLHYLSHADALTVPGTEADGTQIFGDFLESLSICAVNVYVLITGYFQSQSDFHPRKLIRLLAEILFYTLLIPPVLIAFGIHPEAQNVWERWFWFFPVSMESYWFITAYVFLFILSPLLNEGLRALPEKRMREVLLLLLFFYTVLPSLSPVKLTTDRGGYDFGWFIVLYLLSGYMRRYGAGRLDSARSGAVLYFASAAGVFALTALLHRISEGGRLLYYASVPFHYNSFLVLTASVGLFLWAKNTKVKEGRGADFIRALSPLTLGVYLIHENIDVRDRWLPALEKVFGGVPDGGLLLLHMLLCCTALFACCLAVDFVREKMFSLAARIFRRGKKNAVISGK